MFARLPLNVVAIALLGVYLAGCTAADPRAPAQLDHQIETSAETIIAPWVSDGAPGVAVAISQGGEIVFARGAGMANLEQNIPITAQSVFQVASVSKQFTAFATLMLVSEGKIDLDEDIRTYLPELAEPPEMITVRHLLNHTGGLREISTLTVMAGWLDDDIRTHDQIMDLITRQRGVNFEAGAQVEYSNTGYILLAEVVSRVSEMPFEQFTQERIFAPLGMENTQFPASRNDLIPARARSYYPSEGAFKNVITGSEINGSTGLYTTAADLLKWTENFETGQVGDQTVFDLMAERTKSLNGDDSTFAKGQEQRIYNGLETWSHGGRDAGYRSFVLRIPDDDFALSILSNRTDFDTAKMAFALTDVFLRSSPNYKADTNLEWTQASIAQLQSYAGHYEIYPGVIFTIHADDESLHFASLNSAEGSGQLMPQNGERRFLLSPDADISLDFAAPENGQSPALYYTIGLHGTIKAARVDLAPFEPATANLSDYVGTYESTELGTSYTLTLEEGLLVAKHHRRSEFALSPYQTDMFSGHGPLQKVVFVRENGRDVTGMRVSAALSNDLIFARIQR